MLVLMFGTSAKEFKLIVFELLDSGIILPHDNINYMIIFELPFNLRNNIKYEQQIILSIIFLFRMQAIVAVTAIFLFVFLTEIVQKLFTTAY